jgi:hypothetical protein
MKININITLIESTVLNKYSTVSEFCRVIGIEKAVFTNWKDRGYAPAAYAVDFHKYLELPLELMFGINSEPIAPAKTPVYPIEVKAIADKVECLFRKGSLNKHKFLVIEKLLETW